MRKKEEAHVKHTYQSHTRRTTRQILLGESLRTRERVIVAADFIARTVRTHIFLPTRLFFIQKATRNNERRLSYIRLFRGQTRTTKRRARARNKKRKKKKTPIRCRSSPKTKSSATSSFNPQSRAISSTFRFCESCTKRSRVRFRMCS